MAARRELCRIIRHLGSGIGGFLTESFYGRRDDGWQLLRSWQLFGHMSAASGSASLFGFSPSSIISNLTKSFQQSTQASSPVIDQTWRIIGTVSKNKMNREVGGLGHDPKTEPIEAHMEKNNPYCFDDQTVAQAEQMMLNAKVGEIPVVTREKLLVGTINIEAIAQGRRRRERLEPLNPAPESATIGCSIPLLHNE